MQLVAYGAQDLILTGTPQITFFKLVHRRHTNFAIQSIEQVFNGTAGFGRKVTCTIARTGDLVGSMFLQVDLPHLQNWRDQLSMPVETHGHISSVAWVNSIGHALIGAVSVEIGGQKIDEHYGTWLEIWDELTTKTEKRAGYNQMVGKYASDIGLRNNGLSAARTTCRCSSGSARTPASLSRSSPSSSTRSRSTSPSARSTGASSRSTPRATASRAPR